MEVKILNIDPNNSDFHSFYDARLQFYEESHHPYLGPDYVDPDNLLNCKIIIQKDKIMGRLSVYFNPDMRVFGHPVACIGHYECVDDKEISQYLLNSVADDLKALNIEYVVGPMNGSTWNNYRFGLSNNYSNFLMEPYHQTYYNNQFITNGFKVISKYYTTQNLLLEFDHPKVLISEKRLEYENINYRNLDITDFENELLKIYPLVFDSFKENFLFTPLNFIKFKEKYLAAINIIDPQYFIIAEDKNNNVIGFIFAYRDILNPKIPSLVVKTLVRNMSNQWAGLGLVLSNRLVKVAVQNNIHRLIYAFIKDDAPSTFTSNVFNGELYKEYALYLRRL